MSGNYPPGVTGSEPEICGTGLEDKCMRCAENADEETTLAGIPDHVIECNGEMICEDCLYEELKGIGLDPVELAEYIIQNTERKRK